MPGWPSGLRRWARDPLGLCPARVQIPPPAPLQYLILMFKYSLETTIAIISYITRSLTFRVGINRRKAYEYSSFQLILVMSVKLSEPMAMISSLSIAPSTMDRGNGSETRPGIEPRKGCSPKPPRNSRNPRTSGRGGSQIRTNADCKGKQFCY